MQSLQVCPTGGAASGGRSPKSRTLPAVVGPWRNLVRLEWTPSVHDDSGSWCGMTRGSWTVDRSKQGQPARRLRSRLFRTTPPPGDGQALGPASHGLRRTGTVGLRPTQRRLPCDCPVGVHPGKFSEVSTWWPQALLPSAKRPRIDTWGGHKTGPACWVVAASIAMQGLERSLVRHVDLKHRPLMQTFDRMREYTAMPSLRAIHYGCPSIYTHKHDPKSGMCDFVQEQAPTRCAARPETLVATMVGLRYGAPYRHISSSNLRTSTFIQCFCVDNLVIRVADRWQVTSGLFSGANADETSTSRPVTHVHMYKITHRVWCEFRLRLRKLGLKICGMELRTSPHLLSAEIDLPSRDQLKRHGQITSMQWDRSS